MPNPTSKTRQELCSLFVRNAIPTEGDYADLIAASLNQAEDGLLKLPDQPLALLAPKQPPEKVNDPIGVLNFFADPDATDPSWQLQLTPGDKPGIGLADHRKTTRLYLDGTTGNLGVAGNLGVGTAAPAQRLTVEGPWNAGKDPANNLSNAGQLAIKGSHAQLDFIDSDPNQTDWAIHVNDGKLSFVRSPWEDKNLVLDGAGNVGVGTVTPAARLHVAGDIRATGIIQASGYRFSVHGFEFELKDGLLTPISTPLFTRSGKPGKKVEDIDFRNVISYNATDNDKININDHKHHYLTIPAGVEWIFIKLWGAGGGAGRSGSWHYGADGGGGGHTRGLFKVVPNEQLIVVVGRGGTTANGNTPTYGGGGTNKGGKRGLEVDNYGGHGGGYCGVFRTGISRANALAIAGGGGGGGASNDWVGNVGGAGGGLSGQRGASPSERKFTAGGGGGTQKAGGKGGYWENASPGSDGSELLGGASADVQNSGAGGGGYFGGGGGAYSYPRTMGGGGGGSGYTSPEGLLTGTYSGLFRVPAYSWDPDLLSVLAEAEAPGFGGLNQNGVIWSNAQSGGHARAVIYY